MKFISTSSVRTPILLFALLILPASLLPSRGQSAEPAPLFESQPFPQWDAAPLSDQSRFYHLRLLRARLGPDEHGSALFRTMELVIPLAEREFWGRPDQMEALRGALDAEEIELLPGLVVKSGMGADGKPHRFRTAL